MVSSSRTELQGCVCVAVVRFMARRCAVALSGMRPRCKSCFAHGQCHQVSAVSVVRDVRACACSFHKQGPPNGVFSEDAMDNLSRSKSAYQWNW